jgi:hypothetical protein
MFFELQEKYDKSIKPKDAFQIMKRNEAIINEKIKTFNGVVTELHNPDIGKLYVYYYTDQKKGKIYSAFFIINIIKILFKY